MGSRFKEELGYSLVEVMVAILILAIAIIPMVGMFDAGLRAATRGGNYDKGRALANEKMEGIRALSYKELVAKYPPGTYPPNAPACSTGVPGFSCEIRTFFVNTALASDANARSGMQIEVKVTWSGGSGEYQTVGLKTRGQPD